MSTGGDGVGSAGVWDGEGEGVRCGTMLTGGNGMGSAGVWDGEGEGARCGTVSTGGNGVGSAGVWDGEGEGVRCVVVGSRVEVTGRADDVTTELLSKWVVVDVITKKMRETMLTIRTVNLVHLRIKSYSYS